ncbi:hypothetical protein SERLADRAFT_354935 [Serpula lacrymans var. lacrymans S7.9]|uniref:Structural maintenance of chromosomes protein 5 n=1 Tax=Serpula lacrymans var. lacrymans (strain S7.9) TaxID=578457 RepID=F8NPW8_SERL9|nr:uncharacterized protein SERLADRAFT_354935 [Serpula lacrymans var. lacrymans S7.9]EGO27756.1 hypothetical protein SERLADRAFT_354935 [Serpula lacrymans var. lacrymans S7.9]
MDGLPSDVDQGDAEGGSEQEGDGDDDEGSSKAHKRVRVNVEGQSQPSTSANESIGMHRARVQTLPRDVDGFIPGSIVRIQLKNFVTYDWVEFRPGPYLNMILGPNGTGKSSIACAICLGLNWPPSVLGRASELNSFVKLGKDAGHIEIELKGPKGKPNLIICRQLSAKSRGSSFTLNGKSATGKEITNRMAELNVQVGNLCSFLPQDKVSEFAQMTSQQLLRETERAAGDHKLTSWHDTLISSGKELKQLQQIIKDEKERLETMQQRNSDLEREVRMYQERRAIEKEIETLEVLIPVNEYYEAKEIYTEKKKIQRVLHDKVRRLKEKNAPAHALLDQFGHKYKDYERERENKKKAARQKFLQMKSKWTESEKIESLVEEVSGKLESVKKGEKERIKKIKDLEAQNAKWQRELDNPPELEDLQTINAEIKALNSKHSKTGERQLDLQDRQRANADASGAQKAQIEAAMSELKKLDDEKHRKLQNLSKWDKDCADAVAWLRNNQNKFKMEVFEPPVICLTVPDKRYTNAVEACFNANQLKTLVVQCPEDYDTLNHYLNDTDKAGLRKGARINTWFRPKQENMLVGPPMSPDEMASLGFDDYAINYVDCPDGLLWFLKKELNMHRTAIGLNGSKVDVARSMDAVSRFGPKGEGGGATFIAGSIMNIVQRSRYGQRLPQNMTRDVRLARNLVNSAIDPEIKKTLDKRIQEARHALELIEVEAVALAGEETKINAEEKEYKKNHVGILIPSKLATNEGEIQKLENAPSVEDERARLKKKLLELSKKRQLIRALIVNQVDATRSGLEFLQVGANKNALEALCQQKDEAYQKAFAEFEEADKIYQTVKADAKEKCAISKELVQNMDQEFKDRFREMELVSDDEIFLEMCKWLTSGTTQDGSVYARKSDQLRAELDTQRTKLEMNTHTNGSVVEQYEKRQAEISTLDQTVKTRENNAQKIERAIKNARDNWQPALERLVASIGKKFSAAFDRIGCAGEIRINPHEDYDKWAIDILVKFRDREKLQLLTGQRQSGGERSLTTILYLMSLTEEARSPFSLVDEINQGMDMRAERAVHNSMVEVTCKADSAQYFLITPKLLPDLDYHERMKILCVNNGEWLPEQQGLGNMMNMIETFVQHRGRSAAAA